MTSSSKLTQDGRMPGQRAGVGVTDPRSGRCFPLGAAVRPGGVNFSVYSNTAVGMELLLFDQHSTAQPARVIRLNPKRNRTFYYWHVFVPGIGAGQLYGYRAHGPHDPAEGHRFDGSKTLVDPYARAVMYDDKHSRQAACHAGDNAALAMKSVVVDPRGYDWEGDAPLCRPLADTVLYEMHVRGFTRNANSGLPPEKRGTYAGVIEKIPYLQALGVTAVELLPVQQFDEQDAPPGLRNYWGYCPVAFFAPHRGYCSRTSPLGPVEEFRDMVKALHRAGIEVILDVVFTHTAEGNHEGPILSLRGLENRTYYMLQQNRAYYGDFTGCGNTIKGNHSIVRRLIVDCMHYWVQDMHVDGFRFDLASVLSRDGGGQPLLEPPILWEIESDPILAGTKIIAEAWDASGLYQVGSFVGQRWAEWNGPFRDDVRRFVRGDPGLVAPLARRIVGSPDLYPDTSHNVHRCVNLVTCHDGFTLNDLVSYNHKHNEANNEGNRDGADMNHSWNCGVEGPTNDPAIQAIRLRAMKNMLTILMISQGTPMLLMGDEVLRTQGGNNNAYCQDNVLSWFDWAATEHNTEMLRFVRKLIHFRRSHGLFRLERSWAAPSTATRRIIWHGVKLQCPDWRHCSHSLAFSLWDPESQQHVHVILNAYWEPLKFELPALAAGACWHQLLDTALPAPADFCEWGQEPAVAGVEYHAAPRSTIILLARPSNAKDLTNAENAHH